MKGREFKRDSISTFRGTWSKECYRQRAAKLRVLKRLQSVVITSGER